MPGISRVRVRAALRVVPVRACVLLLMLPAAAHAQQRGESVPFACAPVSEYFVDRFRDMALAPDSASRAAWPAELDLPEPTEIVAETDPERCDRVIRATFAREGHFGAYRDARVEVLRLGQAYLVRDPANRAGEWEVVVFLTPDLEVVAAWLQ